MLRPRLLTILLTINAITLLAIVSGATAPSAEQRGVAVWFSPDGGCAETVVDAIRGATRSLDIAIYHLTHPDIAKAIADAHRRRVSVRVIMDDSQSQASYSGATYLHNNQVPVYIWQEGMMHNKFIIVDGKYLLTGSFNFTKSADRTNAENLVAIGDRPAVIDAYSTQFRKLLEHCQAFKPKGSR